MLKFQREVLRDVQSLAGVRSAGISAGGKHDKLAIVTSDGRQLLFPVSATPSDAHAAHQIIRLVRRALP
jgi:hypothetical protein